MGHEVGGPLFIPLSVTLQKQLPQAVYSIGVVGLGFASEFLQALL